MSVLGSWLRRAFRVVGLEVHRVGVRRTMAQALQHAATMGFAPATVIDVGVAEGTHELYATFPSAKHVLIEPLQEYALHIRSIAQKYDVHYIPAAAAGNAGHILMNVHDDFSSSSTLKEVEGQGVDGSVRRVPTVTVDSVCQEGGFSGPYLLKVDVQGAELEVLHGATRTLASTELIVVEVSLFQFFVDGPQLYDVVHYMKQRGFVAYDLFGGHNRPLDNALAQIDMVFVKEDGVFRRSHAYASEAQRQRMAQPKVKRPAKRRRS